MKLHNILITSLLLAGLTGCSQPKSLLDPQLTNFENVYNHGEAKMVDGELHLISEKNWFYSTKKEYQNFILEAEIIMPDTTEFSNSGIIFRGQIEESENGRFIVGYQAEVDPSDRKWTGGLFDQGRRKWLYPTHPTRSHRDKNFIQSYLGEWSDIQGEAYNHLAWNKLKIVCRGADIKIYVNDVLTTHVEDIKDNSGIIAFQHHGSKLFKEQGSRKNIVRFRNVTIEEL
jgi:hypothetical protein